MKHRLNAHAIQRIAKALTHSLPHFDEKAFTKACLHSLDSKELKQRVQHIISVLHQFLPDDFRQAAPVLLNIKKHWHHGESQDQSGGFAAWPVIDYVGVYGLDEPETALAVLKALTPLFSAEFAIRPFIVRHPAITFKHLHAWCNDSDEHVRRLASEGSRPRLPWGMRLQTLCDDPSPILPLLDKLNNDSSAYVRKSVANSLNDIAKDNPDITLAVCTRWQKQASPHTQWIIRHATRTLIKAGNQHAMRLLGFTEKPAIKLGRFTLNPTDITLGETLTISLQLQSLHNLPQQLVIDYAIHHRKANGNTTAKVFKLKNLVLSAEQRCTLNKRHTIKKITTRQYYPGKHSIEILINGQSMGKKDFFLRV